MFQLFFILTNEAEGIQTVKAKAVFLAPKLPKRLKY
jgi:hypothetical protein